MASVPGSSPNIGPIVGGAAVVVVGVGIALIWYLRRRGKKPSTRGIFPFLMSRSEANANASGPPPGAQTQELPGFHHHVPSGIPSQNLYSSLPASEAVAPQPPPSRQTGYTPATEPISSDHPWAKSAHGPSTTPSDPSATTTPGRTSSAPPIHTLGTLPSSAQAPAGPPNGSYHVAANGVQGQIPAEPVEEGLMSHEGHAGLPSAS
jgi:hypothetical protein